ncbi:MAG: GspE/PulE family protein [Planctomycetaceae bacterium]
MWQNNDIAQLTRILVVAWLLTLTPSGAFAQKMEAKKGTAKTAAQEQAEAAAKAPPAPAAGSTSSANRFPNDPNPFVRGNGVRAGQTGAVGDYFSRWGLFFILVIFAAWMYSSRWVDEDSRALKVRGEFWNSIVLLSGVAGFILMFCFPNFILGFLTLLAAYGVPLGFYINERNRRVPEASRVLTPDHIQKTLIRLLARIGIRIGSRETLEMAVGPPITFMGKTSRGEKNDPSRSRQVENSKGYMAAKELVYDAILRRSTDIHLEPKDGELAVRLRIDGVMYPTEPFDTAVGDAVINIFKVLCAMDITEKRRSQDGSFSAELDDREIDFRVATQGTRHGEKMSLRILDQANSVNSMNGLGLRKQLQEQIRSVIHQPHGLFLSCGPTGAGKSTTLYAALSDIDSYQRNIITVEDPIEYKMPNVNQIEVNTKAGQTFANSLRSILRQDPDVLMIGEIRDAETATIACQAANTGHMVFSTVHANDTITALYRLIELGVEPFMIANSVSAILGQRLVRRLCNECRESYKPSRELLTSLGIPVERIDQFFRPPTQQAEPGETCANCGGLGYMGRIGIFELLVITDEIRDLIRENAPASKVKGAARKNGMLYMREEGLRLLAKGVTSIDELQRVVK